MQTGDPHHRNTSPASGAVGASSPVSGDDFKETVRDHTDLVSLVGERVPLQSRSGGRDYVGLCPFHDDSKPSFHVYPERNTYRCWACQEGGDCFSWVMATEKLDFREALEFLANRANLEMPQSGRRGPSGPKKDQVYAACDWAARQFHQALKSDVGKAATEYVLSRGFSAETVEAFQIGFHPEDWTYLLDRARGKFPIEVLAEAKLISQSSKTGDWLDYFVGRVMFPIRNERGQTVAFGGRVLPGGDAAAEEKKGPKYFNSPGSPFYEKERLLFGLDVARESMAETHRAVVVEGYTDCITLHQHGLTDAVGVCGTALTQHHGRLLKRFARRVVLVFDGDAAGIKAAERSVATLAADDLDVRVLILPDGLDPDEFLAENGVDALRALIDGAAEMWPWKLQIAVERHGLDSIDGRSRVVDEMLDVLRNVPRGGSAVRVDLMLDQLSKAVGVGADTLRSQLVGGRPAVTQRRTEPAGGESSPEGQPRPQNLRVRDAVDRVTSAGHRTLDDRCEAELLQAVLAAPEHFATANSALSPEDFTNVALGKLFRACVAVAQQLQDPSQDQVMQILTHPELKRLLVWLDDESRTKRLREEASQEANSGSDGSCPSFLRRSVEQMQWRREEQSSRQLSRELAGASVGVDPDAAPAPTSLDESEEALRRIASFHAQRSGAAPVAASGPS